jgi:integrase
VAAKVQMIRGKWHVVVHRDGVRRWHRLGPTKADKREADRLAKRINAELTLRPHGADEMQNRRLPVESVLRAWVQTHGVTMKPGYRAGVQSIIERHLVPHFGQKDVRELRDADLLAYIRAKLDAGLSATTVANHLKALARTCALLHREELISRNPAARVGELVARVKRSTATEQREVDAWAPGEARTLLQVARDEAPALHPVVALAFGTGMRRGEILALQWADIDFERSRITVRRSWSKGNLTTPKAGKGHLVALPPGVASMLLDLLGQRRRECLGNGWAEVPTWVFPSQSGGLLDERNFQRSWYRVRRRAQAQGVRPLKFHASRHSFATWALGAGRSLAWVADQLGHSSPNVTLRYYAHALPAEAGDLGFADLLTVSDDAKRRRTAHQDKGAGNPVANPSNPLVELRGIEPLTLRLPA